MTSRQISGARESSCTSCCVGTHHLVGRRTPRFSRELRKVIERVFTPASHASGAICNLSITGIYSFEGREWEVVTEAAKDMISQMLMLDFNKRASAKQLCQHRWFQVAATAPAAALGAHMVKRLRAFAGMSRMKRLALVVLARTLTDNDVKRLRVRGGDEEWNFGHRCRSSSILCCSGALCSNGHQPGWTDRQR